MKIKAYAAKEAKGKLEPFEYESDPLGPDEALIKVEHCGICHSDLSMLNNDWGLTQYPFVPGHEIVGIIEEVGSLVTDKSVGQRVGVGWNSGSCMTCECCVTGDKNLCATAEGTIVGRHGGFAEKVKVKAVWAIPMPDSVDVVSAGPLFCGGVTVFNPLVQYAIKPTDRVGVIGIGGLGHMALMFLKHWGCEVTAFSSNPKKADEIKGMGAHNIINSRDPKELEAAQGKFDLILSTVNVTLDWNSYVKTLLPKGRLHFLGATLEPLSIDVFPLLFGQISISASPVGSPSVISRMLEFTGRHEIKPIVETFKFDQVNEAMEHLDSGKARYRIVLSH
jgi:alcohol/geraniol dehydrogenase (NADP+)